MEVAQHGVHMPEFPVPRPEGSLEDAGSDREARLR